MSKQPYSIAVIPGDGIGKEVMVPAVKILEQCAEICDFKLDLKHFDFASCDYYEKHGKMLPDDWFDILRSFDAILFGAVGDPQRVPDHVSLWGSLLTFRRRFDQYVNLRPVRLIPGVPCPLRDPGSVDMMIVRENTEGEYSNIGGHLYEGTEREIVIQETIMTKVGVDRILRYAFELARSRPRKKLTSATKSNGMKYVMPFWDSRLKAISKEYPDIDVEQYHIDILTAHFVQRPSSFDVVVGSNLFGDILSDLGPGCMGALGLAASGNINPKRDLPSLFEPVHGSANDIMGKGIANPVGQIEAVAMMLRHLGESESAQRIVEAVNTVLGRSESTVMTRDLGGQGSTTSLGDAILAAICN